MGTPEKLGAWRLAGASQAKEPGARLLHLNPGYRALNDRGRRRSRAKWIALGIRVLQYANGC